MYSIMEVNGIDFAVVDHTGDFAVLEHPLDSSRIILDTTDMTMTFMNSLFEEGQELLAEPPVVNYQKANGLFAQEAKLKRILNKEKPIANFWQKCQVAMGLKGGHMYANTDFFGN